MIKVGIKTKNCKIYKLLGDSNKSNFITRKLSEANGLPTGQYSVNKNIKLKTPITGSAL